MLQDLAHALTALSQPAGLIEMAALAACVGLSWGLLALLRRAVPRIPPDSILLGRQVFDGALFPLLLLGLALVAGRKRVPRPATGKTALRTVVATVMRLLE